MVVHIEVFSFFNWEGLGFFTAAELFVASAGIVVGMTQRHAIEQHGPDRARDRLLTRALQIYAAYVAAAALVGMLAAADLVDTRAVTTFTDWGAGQIYPLYPPAEATWQEQVAAVLLMRATPHQIQILGLYVCLMLLTMPALWLIRRGHWRVCLALSWIAYAAAAADPPGEPLRVTGSQFEYAFPLLIWQVLFLHAAAAGYYRAEITSWSTPECSRLIVSVAAVLAVSFLLFSLNNPYNAFPAWSRLHLVEPATFYWWYTEFLSKNTLGLLRLVNVLAVLVVLLAVLDAFWPWVERRTGWLFIPMGRASLYVFLMHVPVLILLDNIPGLLGQQPAWDPVLVWLNTAAHAAAILTLWLMVEKRVLFQIVPR